MGSFTVKCPHCGTDFECRAEWIGMYAECTACHHEFFIEPPRKVKIRMDYPETEEYSVEDEDDPNNITEQGEEFFDGRFRNTENRRNAQSYPHPQKQIAQYQHPTGQSAPIRSFSGEKPKKEMTVMEQLKVFCIGFVAVIAGTFLLALLAHSCEGDGKIDENRVEREAFAYAYQASGNRASDFRSDYTIIREDKAVCHFRYKVNGQEYLCSLEFKIEDGKLIYTGNFALDRN